MVYNIQKMTCCFIIGCDEIPCLEKKLKDHFSGLMCSIHKHSQFCSHNLKTKGRDLDLSFSLCTVNLVRDAFIE